MNNLHRELAPISDAAWADLEAEARRTFTAHVAARRVVDVIGPAGLDAGRGRHRPPDRAGRARPTGCRARAAPGPSRWSSSGCRSRVDRQAVDDVERGAKDADWQPVKDAARQIAFAEDRAVFDGLRRPPASPASGPARSNPAIALPADVRELPERGQPRR